MDIEEAKYDQRRVFISSNHAASAITNSDFIIELPEAIKNVVYINWAYCNIGNVLISIDEINNNMMIQGTPYWRYIGDSYSGATLFRCMTFINAPFSRADNVITTTLATIPFSMAYFTYQQTPGTGGVYNLTSQNKNFCVVTDGTSDPYPVRISSSYENHIDHFVFRDTTAGKTYTWFNLPTFSGNLPFGPTKDQIVLFLEYLNSRQTSVSFITNLDTTGMTPVRVSPHTGDVAGGTPTNSNPQKAYLPDQLQQPKSLRRMHIKLLDPDTGLAADLDPMTRVHLELELWSLKA